MSEQRPAGQPLTLYRLAVPDRVMPDVALPDCVTALRALGEETRVRIVGLLLEAALDVGEISKHLGVTPYNVSKHLRILREAGILAVHKDGRRHLYALPDAFRRQAAQGGVLDLGCCTFKFDANRTEIRALDASDPESAGADAVRYLPSALSPS